MKIIATIMLLLTAATCFAQAIIEGDPAEPSGPPRPDYWVGRHDDRLSPIRGEVGEGSNKERQQTKAFTAAALDSYVFFSTVRVNDNPAGTSYETPYSSGGHAMAARGDTVYLAWRSDRLVGSGGNTTIYFDKSVDGGNTWGMDVRITDSDSAALMPALAVGIDGTIYVSWTDFRDASGYRHIYFAKSTNGGASFGPSVRVSAESGEMPQQKSSIAVNDSGYIFIAYEDWRNYTVTAMDIFCSRSFDSGASFLPAVKVNSDIDSIDQWFPSIAAKDTMVYVVWEDFRDTAYTGGGEIVCFSKSSNSGGSFNINKLVNDTVGLSPYNAGTPSMAAFDTLIYIAWYDNRTPGDIYFTKSTNFGISFITPNINLIDVVGQPYGQGYPSLACDDSGGVYCAWEDKRNAELIYFCFSKNYGDSFSNNIHVDDRPLGDSCWLWTPTICVNKAGRVFAAWMDNRTDYNDYDIYVTSGWPTGIENKPQEDTMLHGKPSLAIYPNPFKNRTTIKYELTKKTNVVLNVYNITGELVKVIENVGKTPGIYSVDWASINDDGRLVSNGIYFVYLSLSGSKFTRKITLIR